MRLLWTRLALNDRSAIFHHNDAHTAIEIDVVIEETMEELAIYPENGNPYMHEGIYMMEICNGYVIVYDIAGKYVRILRLLHLS
jgi:plasmid stabilization system protein ParE